MYVHTHDFGPLAKFHSRWERLEWRVNKMLHLLLSGSCGRCWRLALHELCQCRWLINNLFCIVIFVVASLKEVSYVANFCVEKVKKKLKIFFLICFCFCDYFVKMLPNELLSQSSGVKAAQGIYDIFLLLHTYAHMYIFIVWTYVHIHLVFFYSVCHSFLHMIL